MIHRGGAEYAEENAEELKMPKRRFKSIVFFLLLGLAATVGSALACAALVDIDKGAQTALQRGEWSVSVTETSGAVKIETRRAPASWSPEQATGAPDTPTAGDQSSAWAAKSHDGSPEWLMLEYEHPIVPKRIDVYETYNPGALTRVTLVDERGTETEVWSGDDDPTPKGSGMGVSTITLQKTVAATRRIKLYIGRPEIPGWNEIDAVGAIDESGKTHWAADAVASSWYGESAPQPPGASPEALLPSWSGLAPLMGKTTPRRANWEQHTVDARGWPMVALFSRTEIAESASMSKSLYLSSPYSSLTSLGSGYASPASVTLPRRIIWPWRPIWGGLLVDTLLYATAIAALWGLCTKPRRFFREVSRVKRGCCVACGYDLGYDLARGCPECGWRRN
jgi:hypothetical protein